MNAPLITIGITCYNAADTIGRAIESARNQDWPNKEIIVVDDYSTDTSRDVVRQYTDVKLIEHALNKGPGGARQSLVESARGEFLIFFDDDDESFSNRLQEQYYRIITFEREYGSVLCACYAAGEKIYPNGYKVDIIPPGILKPPHGPDMAGRILYYKDLGQDWDLGVTPSCALMSRTETFKKVGGFDENFRRIEDLDFSVRLALADGYFIGTQEKLFYQYATQADDKSHKKNLDSEQQLIRKHRSYLEQEKTYKHALLWSELRFHHFEKNYIAFFMTLFQLLIDAPRLTITHLFNTGPKRLRHEKRMRT